jgi:hypothetical protein
MPTNTTARRTDIAELNLNDSGKTGNQSEQALSTTSAGSNSQNPAVILPVSF